MAIFRVQKSKENPYIMINKFGIFDNRLSFKAKGILVYMLSRPDDWQFYESEILKHTSDGKDSLKNGIKELIKYGYIVRHEKRELGRFAGYEYIVYEMPVDVVGEDEEAVFIEDDFETRGEIKDFTVSEKPLRKNRYGKTDNGKTATEKPLLLNNDITNKINKLNNDVVVIEQQQEFQKIIDAFNNNIHLITPIELEKLNSWLEDMEAEVIILAIEEAVAANKRNFKYINAILNNWHTQGLKTKADVEEYLRNWSKKKEQPKSSWKEADLTGLM
ncbi:MAG: replication protein [Caloramator sp.]|nr:MAG: replication protein [Caloramator sp.]